VADEPFLSTYYSDLAATHTKKGVDRLLSVNVLPPFQSGAEDLIRTFVNTLFV
jgi:hypothetical protein